MYPSANRGVRVAMALTVLMGAVLPHVADIPERSHAEGRNHIDPGAAPASPPGIPPQDVRASSKTLPVCRGPQPVGWPDSPMGVIVASRFASCRAVMQRPSAHPNSDLNGSPLLHLGCLFTL